MPKSPCPLHDGHFPPSIEHFYRHCFTIKSPFSLFASRQEKTYPSANPWIYLSPKFADAPFPGIPVDSLGQVQKAIKIAGIVAILCFTHEITVIKKAIELNANFIHRIHEPTFYKSSDERPWLENDPI